MLSWEADVEAHALREQGWTISAIARHLGHDRKTVRAYLEGWRVPEVRVRREPTLTEPGDQRNHLTPTHERTSP